MKFKNFQYLLKPNILFIVVDSLRNDKCIDNNKSSITPNLDNLIKSGTTFEQAISTVGSTGSSLASIFTSLFPFKTGMSSEKFQKLHPKAKSVVTILKENGYNTYAASTPLASALGLVDNFQQEEKHYHNYYSLFEGLGDEILSSLIKNNFNSPWFFYVHINDLHQPIIVPKSYNDEKFGSTNYEKMISSIDEWIGKFLNQIDITKTIIVITSDHGDYLSSLTKDKNLNFESDSTEQFLWKMGNNLPIFMRPLKLKISQLMRKKRTQKKESKLKDLSLTTYEKRLLLASRLGPGHHMFDDIIHVPLIFSGYKIPQKKISQQVRHVDLFPTILDILDLKIDHEIHGKSLNPLINDEKLSESPAYIESPPTIEKSRPKMIGIRTSKYKYIRSLEDSDSDIELYDLSNDPHEEINVAKKLPEIVKKYEKLLLEIYKDPIDENEFVELSDAQNAEIENELKKLGYI